MQRFLLTIIGFSKWCYVRFSPSTLLFAFFFCPINLVSGQTNINTASILAREATSIAEWPLQKSLDWLKNSQQEMPIIEELQFRTETDEWEVEQQEYLFRMSFNNRASRLAHREIVKGNIHSFELMGEEINELALAKRYKQITEWHFIQLELASLALVKDLVADKKIIYQKMLSNALEFDLDNLLKAEEELQDLEQEVWQLEQRKVFLIQQLLPTESSNYQLEDTSWISMETMEQVLQNSKDLPIHNWDLRKQKTEVQFAQLEYDLEKAEAKKVIDFVQFKYAARNKLEGYQEWSLGLGFNIPTPSTNILKTNEAQLEIFEKQFQQAFIQENIEEKLSVAYAKFQSLIQEHQFIKKNNSEHSLEETYEKYRNVGDLSPLVLLRLKESILKNQKKLKRIEEKACNLFIEILTLKGVIHLYPRVNYLSNELASF